MGQYQQWLLCQETDQSLRRKLEALEAERAALLERISQLEREQPRPGNQLVRLLLSALGEEGQQQGQQARISFSPLSSSSSSSSGGATVIPPRRSPAEVAGGGAGSSPMRMPVPGPGAEQLGGNSSLPHKEGLAQLGLPLKLQELELPEWLHRLTISSGKDRRPGPIDEERIRTNRLVQRWLERWGRIPPSSTSSSSQSPSLREGLTQE